MSKHPHICVPEVDALLKRWAQEIKAIAHLLNERDVGARVQLDLLSGQLTTFDTLVRLHVVRFEEQLAKFKARVQQTRSAPGAAEKRAARRH